MSLIRSYFTFEIRSRIYFLQMEKYTRYFPEEGDAAAEIIRLLSEKIIPALNRLEEVEFPTEEENKQKEELLLCLNTAIPVLETFCAGLGQHLFQFSQALTLDAKLKGEKGDEQKMQFYLDLKDSFHSALREGLKDN
jgi:hypothetical protein